LGYIARILAGVRRRLKWQRPYAYRPSHNVVADYADFAGIPIPEVVRRINSYKALTKSEWESLPEGDFKSKAGAFYGLSEYYICDIITANVSKEAIRDSLNGISPSILASIKKHPGHRFLEFGGGTGVFCEMIADMGKDATYLDIPGRQFEFAKWRFAKYGIPVKMIQTVPSKLVLTEEYDLIFSNAVMEHLADPFTPTAELARHIAPGGLLILLVDITGEEEDMPMHRNVDIIRIHEVIAEAGLVNLEGKNMFWSIWSRPLKG
jgi:2-polyprenyl-3-methyl-5-hydroxy-6-metoxy-1,4-benzoquinol methylase